MNVLVAVMKEITALKLAAIRIAERFDIIWKAT
jgi:hypothetical protein